MVMWSCGGCLRRAVFKLLWLTGLRRSQAAIYSSSEFTHFINAVIKISIGNYQLETLL